MRPLLIVLLALSLSGCMGPWRNADDGTDRPRVDLLALSYGAADRLIDNLQEDMPATPLLVTSLANLDDLGTSSTLGRLISELVGSRLSQRGYAVREIKMRGTVLVRERGGEFVLSRDSRVIGRKYRADAIVTGTYVVAGRMVYVSLRAVRAADSRLISSVDFRFPADRSVWSTLGYVYATWP